MKKSDRAKIFAPFSPLKGLYEALCEKERIIVPKAELCDEHIEEIDRVLHSIECGDVVEVVFYNNGVYEKMTAFYGRESIIAPNCGEEKFLEFAQKHKKVILKPLKGSLGSGVFVFQYEDEEHTRKCFRDLTAEMVCEEYIVQHSKMSALNPDTVNTVRVVSIRECDDVEIAAVTFKMAAKKGTVVDNMGHGGLIALVDPKTGIVTSFGMDKSKNQYAYHPVSGVQIIGMNIPNWPAVIALVKKAHLQLDESRVLGWDIAVTETGAVVVEANSAPAPSILQMIDNQPKGEKILEVLNNKKYQVYNK